MTETSVAPTEDRNDAVVQPAAVDYAALMGSRRETFLARLSRKTKLSLLVIVLVLLSLPFWRVSHDGTSHRSAGHEGDAAGRGLSHEEAALGEGHSGAPDNTGHSKSSAMPVEPVLLKTDLEKNAAAMNDGTMEGQPPLSAAPDLALVEETPAGRLPRVSADGRKPWQVYAKPFNFQDPRPRIVLVMMDLGISRVATDAALRRMPPAVTLAFDVQSPAVGDWLARARQDGHETLLSLSMEPQDYPRNDPGPKALLTTLPNTDNIQRLMDALRSGAGYVGVTTSSGSRFLADSQKMMPVMRELRDRGLLFLDSKVARFGAGTSLAIELGVPWALSSREVDAAPDAASIDAALAQLEQSARLEGSVVGLASPLPVTMERIEKWSKTLAQKGLVLAPVSAVVK